VGKTLGPTKTLLSFVLAHLFLLHRANLSPHQDLVDLARNVVVKTSNDHVFAPLDEFQTTHLESVGVSSVEWQMSLKAGSTLRR
jgi:hypothetical protein